MNKFEKLCQDASDADVEIIDYQFSSDSIKGLYCDGTIAIDINMHAESEKACVLAEELGHHYTTVGDIIDQSSFGNRKQERRARLWAYQNMISLRDIVDSYKSGCQNQYEIAEHLEVTEEFLVDCINCYKEKYGICTRFENYLIYFDPLGVLEFTNNQ